VLKRYYSWSNPPYLLESNEVVESKNMTFKEMMNDMLISFNAPGNL